MKTEKVELDREVIRVHEWRADWFRHGGFTKRNANILAASDIEYRYANQVLKACTAKGFTEDFVMELIQ